MAPASEAPCPWATAPPSVTTVMGLPASARRQSDTGISADHRDTSARAGSRGEAPGRGRASCRLQSGDSPPTITCAMSRMTAAWQPTGPAAQQQRTSKKLGGNRLQPAPTAPVGKPPCHILLGQQRRPGHAQIRGGQRRRWQRGGRVLADVLQGGASREGAEWGAHHPAWRPLNQRSPSEAWSSLRAL